jgi:non-ribosomal peptide synthetase component F
LALQYADFAIWQREWLQGEALDSLRDYWLDQLAGASEVISLPTDRPRPTAQSYRGALYPFRLTSDFITELRSVSRLEGVTLFMTMLAGLQAVLHYLTGRDDVVVGTDVAGRNRAEIEPLIGFFINQLVLRTDFSGNPSLRQLLGRVREVALGAYAHQDLPFDKLVEALNPERKLSHSPLFQVKLVFQNAADLSQTLRLNGLSVKSLGGETRKAKFDLLLTLTETAHGLHGSMEYSTDLFNPGTIERIISLFQTTLQNIAAEPDLSLSDLLEVLAETDRHRQLMNERELEHARAQKYQNVRRTALSA